ncbi:hypothetical protein Slin15195_G074370 [Septoria linicola]|uniref:Uncharacterized protein n=1 Tax=Septoria linicola TaxID=215465 RepID=A0A9Q9AXY6_9PEZI|nr:hypothetical protein Slin14017_G035490 [Septoria linicola]USW54118.1 hypothetical protein Slin15195_G074370 [Septoria linicola]
MVSLAREVQPVRNARSDTDVVVHKTLLAFNHSAGYGMMAPECMILWDLIRNMPPPHLTTGFLSTVASHWREGGSLKFLQRTGKLGSACFAFYTVAMTHGYMIHDERWLDQLRRERDPVYDSTAFRITSITSTLAGGGLAAARVLPGKGRLLGIIGGAMAGNYASSIPFQGYIGFQSWIQEKTEQVATRR